MNISLTAELENYIHQKVESGQYRSASEVIREGLRLLQEQDELHQRGLADLRMEVARGVEQADRGQVSPFTEETTERVKARGRARLAAENGADPP